MKQELEQKLINSFPLLYKDCDKSIFESCMGRGFECQDGWYNIIFELSSKLEPLIKEWIVSANDSDKKYCECGCEFLTHVHDTILSPSEDKSCTSVFNIPFESKFFKKLSMQSIPNSVYKAKTLYGFIKRFWWRFKVSFGHKGIKFLYKLCSWKILYKKVNCGCKKFILEHPSAAQVKEKFGTLRFYMTLETEEMSKLIRQYEKMSCNICEYCGLYAKTISINNWYVTICDKCRIEKNNEQ